MADLSISAKSDALLLFTDIIDSSIYSTILGINGYAKKILEFQKLFEELAALYFPDRPYFQEPVTAWRSISARGDEGIVFIVNPRENGSDLVYQAVKFSCELKARLKLLNKSGAAEKEDRDIPPKEMRIAVGIHYGTVATVTKRIEKNGIIRSFIDNIIGYSINYAKRVESSARIGKFSQIFLSKEAAELLGEWPIVVYKHFSSLKGIQENEEVFEIQSAYLPGIPIEIDGSRMIPDNEQFLNYYFGNDGNDIEREFLRESWLKSFVLSLMDSRKDQIRGDSLKESYHDKIAKFAWKNPVEDDPILLFWRAKECQIKQKFTRAVTCYKKILEKHPVFIPARIKLIEVCYQILNSDGEISSERIFVKDTAEEFLERYNSILSNEERKIFEEILKM